MVLESEKKASSFFQSCMQESRLTRLQTLQDFHALLHNISHSPEMGAIPALLELINSYNAWPLFRVTVGADETDPEKNILKVVLPTTIFIKNIG